MSPPHVNIFYKLKWNSNMVIIVPNTDGFPKKKLSSEIVTNNLENTVNKSYYNFPKHPAQRAAALRRCVARP